MWTAEAVLEFNADQDPASETMLKRMASQAGASLEHLASVANEIEGRDTHHVCALFQLPFPVSVAPGWYKLPTGEDKVFADVRFEVLSLDFTSNHAITLHPLTDRTPPYTPLVTQVTALVPVWGARSNYHQKYLSLLDREGSWKEIVIPKSSSWIGLRGEFGNRPANVRDYEHNFASKLLKMARPMLHNFLPSYSLQTRSDAKVPDVLNGYCAMLAPGRVVFAGSYIPVYQSMLAASAERIPPPKCDRPSIEAALKAPYRELSGFELQLVALEGLRRRGEIAIALVGAISLLEWLVVNHLAKQGITVRTFATAIRNPKTDFINSEERELILAVKGFRNDAVHEDLPIRSSMRSGRQVFVDAEVTVPEMAEKFFELVFEIYRRLNRLQS